MGLQRIPEEMDPPLHAHLLFGSCAPSGPAPRDSPLPLGQLVHGASAGPSVGSGQSIGPSILGRPLPTSRPRSRNVRQAMTGRACGSWHRRPPRSASRSCPRAPLRLTAAATGRWYFLLCALASTGLDSFMLERIATLGRAVVLSAQKKPVKAAKAATDCRDPVLLKT
jgi:hypothetical protein